MEGDHLGVIGTNKLRVNSNHSRHCLRLIVSLQPTHINWKVEFSETMEDASN